MQRIERDAPRFLRRRPAVAEASRRRQERETREYAPQQADGVSLQLLGRSSVPSGAPSIEHERIRARASTAEDQIERLHQAPATGQTAVCRNGEGRTPRTDRERTAVLGLQKTLESGLARMSKHLGVRVRNRQRSGGNRHVDGIRAARDAIETHAQERHHAREKVRPWVFNSTGQSRRRQRKAQGRATGQPDRPCARPTRNIHHARSHFKGRTDSRRLCS